MSEFLRVAQPEGLAVFGIPARSRSRTRSSRAAGCMRSFAALGVPEDWMLRRTPLTPMRMTVVPEAAVRRCSREHGAQVLLAEQLEDGPVPHRALLRGAGCRR